jgi:hypothetical protein
MRGFNTFSRLLRASWREVRARREHRRDKASFPWAGVAALNLAGPRDGDRGGREKLAVAVGVKPRTSSPMNPKAREYVEWSAGLSFVAARNFWHQTYLTYH